MQIDLRTLRALVWGEPPTNKIFIYKPTPRSNFCLLAPPNSQSIHPHLVGWTLRAPGLGEPPTNKILHCKPTTRRNFCLLPPQPILLPFRVFQTGSLGSTFGGCPLARCRARVKWGTHAKFWGDTYIHTHTHTHFHLYIVDSTLDFDYRVHDSRKFWLNFDFQVSSYWFD